MGKQYYCDYCDRSFKDETDARKKHLSSLQHINNKTNHYNLFKDPRDILREESKKIPCNKFINYGECNFGNNCRFSHLTPAMTWELQRMVAWKDELLWSQQMRNMPNENEIIDEYFQCPIVTNDENEEIINYSIWNIPSELKNYPNLPPSLWPITPKSVTDINFGKWG
ncbi:hypothetical protein PV327_008214 [Microctonus hyperodae]|uniref:C3H1-type domain-containing protein n=1 Tax=Microctonus hyperodae TaxID=165561 RepID=A0AA39KGR1_MICHY|nr:hypothetical protein PV327_008214 [Microctonus hyperodae]